MTIVDLRLLQIFAKAGSSYCLSPCLSQPCHNLVTTYVIAIPDSIEFLFDANLPEAVDISFSID